MKKSELLYPIDSANFKWIRENGFVYVDKTRYIHLLLRSKGKYYFLARPRRFGKSLFLDTLAEYFMGHRSLFEGLEICRYHPHEWEAYPVIRLNLSGQAYHEKDTLFAHLSAVLRNFEEEFGVSKPDEHLSVPDRFLNLIRNVSLKTGKGVIVLIDEYDDPLASAIDKPDLQEIYREQLHGFYGTLKKAEEYIKFCMLTGVTRFVKVSIFSGLNNLCDITFDDEFAGVCGVTEEELHRFYGAGASALAEKLGIAKEEVYRRLKYYYDGYHFSENLLDIYNPYSINHVFKKGSFQDYWCQTGIPTILSKILMNSDFDVEKLNGKKAVASDLVDLSMFETNPIPLFYQTGYLTLKSFEDRRGIYTLGFPNREVESGILRNILTAYTNRKDSNHVIGPQASTKRKYGDLEVSAPTVS